MKSLSPYYKSSNKNFTLLKGDCLELLGSFEFKFDLIFADPPYFLSNGGFSVQSGKQVSVNKGDWDKSKSFAEDSRFNYEWLRLCRDKLSDSGTIWISGTHHNIFDVAQNLRLLEYKILNVITWQKTNPPPNLSCRYFTHSTEFIIWARKSEKSRHCYNYELMKEINGGLQMKDVWSMPAIGKWEKSCGKHPTQKPLPLLARIIAASSLESAWILDPFSGSSTTGIAASLLNRKYLGLEQDQQYLEIAKNRRLEIEDYEIFDSYRNKLGIPRRGMEHTPLDLTKARNEISETNVGLDAAVIDLPF